MRIINKVKHNILKKLSNWMKSIKKWRELRKILNIFEMMIVSGKLLRIRTLAFYLSLNFFLFWDICCSFLCEREEFFESFYHFIYCLESFHFYKREHFYPVVEDHACTSIFCIPYTSTYTLKHAGYHRKF